MSYTPEMIPQFINRIEQAKTEQEIAVASHEIKTAVAKRYPNENSRRRPMSEIRKAIRERFPIKETEKQDAPFPYFWTNSGKGKVSRWEHLAIKYLVEEWNLKQPSQPEHLQQPLAVETKKPVSLLDALGLSAEELEGVKNAIANSGLTEVDWLKAAVKQRANQDNALRAYQDEDLSTVPSQVLMTENRYRTNSKATYELTSRAVRAIKDFNTNSPEHKWCITNKLISELTLNTVKAIAKAVEGMGLEDYNKMMGLTPVVNRITKQRLGKSLSEVVSIKDYLGVEQ